MGICQVVPVIHQVTCHTINWLRDSWSYSHSHVVLTHCPRALFKDVLLLQCLKVSGWAGENVGIVCEMQ